MNPRVRELAEFHNVDINVMQAIYDDIYSMIMSGAAQMSDAGYESSTKEKYDAAVQQRMNNEPTD